MAEEVKVKKTKECIHCRLFFDCKGKPPEVKDCILFDERKEGEAVARKKQEVIRGVQ